MRVLLICEAANPEWSSVPLVGWNLYRALSRRLPVHLVTQVRNREALVRAGLGESDFTAIDSEAVAKPLWRLGTLLRGGASLSWTTATAIGALSYPYFERLVWRSFGAEIRRGRFDVVHQATPLSPTIPSLLATRCRGAGVPWVWGPINGGVAWPRGFDRARRREKEWLSYVRGMYRLLPGYRSTRRDASAILVGSRATLEQMPWEARRRCRYLPENGVDLGRFRESQPKPPAPPLRVAFAGRLVPYKGADMLVEAAGPLVRAGRVRLEVIGDGPARGELERLSERECGGAVEFTGWLPQEELARRLGGAHIFGFPSIREFGGAVVMEAMALGAVPLIVEYGGPGDLASPETTLTVPIGPRDSIVRGLRGHLERCLDEPGILPIIADAGRRRVTEEFTWDAKARSIELIYDGVCRRR